MGNVRMIFSADEAQQVRAFMKLSGKADHLRRKQKQLNKTAQEGADKSAKKTKGWNQSLARVGRTAMSMAGAGGAFMLVYKAVNMIKNEIDQIHYRQKQVAQFGLGMQGARYQALKNMPSSMEPADLDDLIQRVSDKSKATPKNLYKLASSALSARGQIGDEGFERAMELGGQLVARGEDPATAKQIVGGILDMMKATGDESAAGAFGFMREFGTMTRMTDVAKQARALGQVSAAAPGFGATVEQGAELAAYLTQTGTDVQGRQATTGAIKFMEALATAEISKEQYAADTYKERLAAVQRAYQAGDKGRRGEIMTKIGGEAKMKGPIMALLREDPESMKAYRTAQAGIGAPGGLANVERTRKFLETTAGGEYGEMQKLSQLFSVGTEKMMAASPNKLAGIMRDSLSDLFKRMPGISDYEEKLAMMSFESRTWLGTGDVVEHTTDILKQIREREQYGKKRVPKRDLARKATTGPLGALIDEAAYRTGLRSRTESNLPGAGGSYNPKAQAALNNVIEGLIALQEKPQPVTVESDVRGAKVEHTVKVKEQRSPQGSRLAGVE